jgi:perosamine synthetase
MNIPITKPFFDQSEFDIIQKPLRTGWVVQGPYVKDFETKFAEFTGSKYAVALNSCTSGQFILSRIIGLNPGDEVLVPAFTWISTANAVEFLGAKVVFSDIDLDTYNIDVAKAEEKINDRTKAIFPVHLFGLPADMPEIMRLSKRYGLRVVEDAACGLGGKLAEQHCGTIGDAGVFSFHPRKSITTGEGGMIVTDDENIALQASSLREHGAVKADYERHKNKSAYLLNEYPTLGYNMRMTDIQGALGVAQMEKLPRILDIKQKLAREYDERLSGVNWLKAPQLPENYTHGYQAYCTLFKPEEALAAVAHRDLTRIDQLHEERNLLMARLERKGIATRQGTHAVHIQELYRKRYNIHPMEYPAAYAADRLTLAIPFFPIISDEEKDFIFNELLS